MIQGIKYILYQIDTHKDFLKNEAVQFFSLVGFYIGMITLTILVAFLVWEYFLTVIIATILFAIKGYIKRR